ncbi:MAG: hypothetical protein RRZ92_04120, partial [Bacilli bacterium]
ISAGKTSFEYFALFDATKLGDIDDGNNTYIKKGNALTIDAILKTETTESKHLLELNDHGLITKEEVSIVTPTTTQTTSIKVEYNVAITKKTQL